MAKKKAEEKESSADPVEAPEEKPNVIWADKDHEPPTSVQIGITKIPLPDAELQKAGFFSASASRLVRSINGYKYFNRR